MRKLIVFIRGQLAGRILFFLAATGLQIALAIAILPLTTIVLTATDFGYFALMMSLAAFVNAVTDGGGSLALHAHYGVATPDERRPMVASFLLVAFSLSSILSISFVVVWPLLVPFIIGADGEEFSWTIVVLTAALIPLRSLSVMATSILSVAGRANAIAAQIASQALGAFAATSFGLFILHWGVSALFAGAVAGQVASLAVAAVALGRQPWTRPSRRWLAVARDHAPTSALSGLSDGVRGVGENSVIVGSLGVASLGFYSHARLYYGMLLTTTNAVSHNIWSTSLAEAREKGGQFVKTVYVWTLVHIGLTLFGIGAVCFGGDIVQLLTNGRLTPAAAMIPWLVNLLLIGLSGRIQNAVVYAQGGAKAANRVRAVLSLAALASLVFVMNASFGMGGDFAGLIGVLLMEAALFRLYLRWKARKFAKSVAFRDWWVIAGLLAISALYAVNRLYEWSLATRCVVFGVAVASAVVVERRRIASLRHLI
ncbi:Membrane protein involved in the export of O-antigen and teichoic acid [Bradyrhizobium sp. Rc3b]|uniref:lipopolysaccharide biosynthesis protein n=1 Tax=unclassified Bradyrhizobium TaxID=2631580 RepID=UPI0008EB1B96|nr:MULTISPECIES: oligosaccharide flippase family protein [unclassified Bradyrhizobium]MBB4376193.1 O-antigen/teichoic acid export membrane protein [Bradyrhizobium sp. SBR1B]SFN44565.1 Membrane protein involved in the export of O-antigen and teichoic acid [Bradyrhizobium sp. Rc3b]